MNKKEKLQKLRKKMAKADLPLKDGATRLVFGDGNSNAEILFIGEGPGYWEDQKGIPFVGNAGALLNQVLALIKIPREDVFITNVVHYRPPENRDPTPEEMAAFKPYLDGIINIIEPKMIVTLGRFSMAKFIPGVYISGVHGKPRVVEFGGRKVLVMPMYHPAAALRNGSIKELFKADFLGIPKALADFEANDDTIESAEKDEKEEESEQMSLI